MSIRPLILIAALGPGIAGSLAAGDYALAPTTLDHGGLQAGSANYAASFSAAPGGQGASVNYRLRSGYAAQLFDPDPLPAVDFVLPASLAADGSGKAVSASAGGVGTLRISYEGRGFTSYDRSSSAPAAPGLYRVNVTAVSQEYTGLAFRDFVISGPIAAPDSLTKQSASSPLSIRLDELLANDTRVLPDGSVTSEGLSILQVNPGAANRVFLGEDEDAGWIFFLPSSSPTEAFGYVVSDGISSAEGVVSVAVAGGTPAFTLQIVGRGQPVFDGSRTRLAMDFIGVPGQDYQIEWSEDLSHWVPAGTNSTGPTGSFTVVFAADGDHVESWSRSLFFRAKR
jgi:hypothetical protein